MNKSFTPYKLFIRFLLYLVVAWTLGFGLFFLRLPQPMDTKNLKADAIVVLTGGIGRLTAGTSLLQQKVAHRMLISGVHPDVMKKDLIALTSATPDLFACCIDLDHAAGNTLENASETATWAANNNVHTLIVVTADYHIQRSRLLFNRAMPEATIIPYPVKADTNIFTLAREYSKYLIVLFQEAIHA